MQFKGSNWFAPFTGISTGPAFQLPAWGMINGTGNGSGAACKCPNIERM
jgi:hypothetical protein